MKPSKRTLIKFPARQAAATSSALTAGVASGAVSYTHLDVYKRQALDNLLARDFSQYRELVFCGFGEPMYRTDDIVWLVDELKKRVPNLPPVRINTNGHANLFLGCLLYTSRCV